MAAAEEQAKEGEAPEAAAPATTGKNKKILIIGLAVGIVFVAIGIAVAVLSSDDKTRTLASDAAIEGFQNKNMIEEGAGEEVGYDENTEALGALFPLDTFLVNLTGGGFVRVQMQVEFTGRTVSKRFQGKIVPIRDGIIQLLLGKRREELLNKEGQENVKMEIIALINELLSRPDIKNVYFTNFVIQ